MSEEKKGQELSADDLKQVAGGAIPRQKLNAKEQELSAAELDKVAGGFKKGGPPKAL
jgi:hypothetical protein